MTKRKKKKLIKRKQFFRYSEYKQRIQIYNSFVSELDNVPLPESIKDCFLEQLEFIVFRKLPKRIYDRNYTIYNKDILVDEICKFIRTDKTSVRDLINQFNCVQDCFEQSFEIM